MTCELSGDIFPGSGRLNRMQNSVSQQQAYSQLYGNGYADNFSDFPMQMGSKLNGNDSSFYIDSSLYPEEDEFDGLFAFCSQVPFNYQPGATFQTQTNINGFDHSSLGVTFKSNCIHDTKKQLQLSQVDSITAPTNQYGIRNTRKRQVDNANVFQQRLPEIIEENKSNGAYWPPNKKISLCFQGQQQSHLNNKDLKEAKKDRVPAKRSLKLADRITALQKLVSPYGKTDTASVLHEASMFIKALQEQIENMFHTQNPSNDETDSIQTNGEKQYNLRNKGLCLISLSNTRKLVLEDELINHYAPVFNSPLSPDTLSTFM